MGGAGIRLIQLLANRSLWLDEAALALNLFGKSFLFLTGRLGHGQIGPIGFLWIEKGVVSLLGSGETALRLFPFLCGLIALAVFAYVADAILPPAGAVVSVALLAVNHRLIYYSSEVKQYSTEVASAAGLFAVGLMLLHGPLRPRRVAVCALLGTLAGWISFTACYGLAAIGAALAVSAYVRRNRRDLLTASLLSVYWGAALAPALLLARGNPAGGELRVLPRYWADGFGPSGGFVDLVGWTRTAFHAIVIYLFELRPFGWTFGWLALTLLAGAWILLRIGLAGRPLLAFGVSTPLLVALVGGAASVYPFGGRLSMGKLLFAAFLITLILGSGSLGRRRPELLALVAGPIVLAWVGGAVHAFPFQGRLMLFLIPSFLLLIGEGIGAAWSDAGAWDLVRSVGAGAAGSLLAASALATTLHRLPEYREELRPVLERVFRTARPGDSVYVLNGGVRAFEYYRTRLSPPPLDVTLGCCLINQWPRYLDALQRLEGRPRVWLVLTHWRDSELSFLLLAMDRFGTRRAEYRAWGAAAYLYELPPIEPGAIRDVLAVVPPDRDLPQMDWICDAGPVVVPGCPTPTPIPVSNSDAASPSPCRSIVADDQRRDRRVLRLLGEGARADRPRRRPHPVGPPRVDLAGG